MENFFLIRLFICVHDLCFTTNINIRELWATDTWNRIQIMSHVVTSFLHWLHIHFQDVCLCYRLSKSLQCLLNYVQCLLNAMFRARNCDCLLFMCIALAIEKCVYFMVFSWYENPAYQLFRDSLMVYVLNESMM